MRSLLRARWLRVALVALLLAAQHEALTHALYHAGRPAPDAAASVAHNGGPAQAGGADEHDHAPANTAAERCAFHLAFSQVLGGVHSGAVVDILAATPHALPIAALPVPRGEFSVVPYQSRAPPAFS